MGDGGGESDGQGFISWAPGFLRYGPNHVCLFFQGDKFMTFDQSLKVSKVKNCRASPTLSS